MLSDVFIVTDPFFYGGGRKSFPLIDIGWTLVYYSQHIKSLKKLSPPECQSFQITSLVSTANVVLDLKAIYQYMPLDQLLYSFLSQPCIMLIPLDTRDQSS
jgi:hypothetical protein